MEDTNNNLLEHSYVENGTLIIDVDDITTLDIKEEEVNNLVSSQKKRFDKGVILRDKNGKEKKLSSILLGYNKRGITLKDGSFCSVDDLKNAMEDAINRLDKGTILVDKKGKHLNINELIDLVKHTAGTIIIEGPSEKITNQDTRRVSVQGAESDKVYKNGLSFLGNDQLSLDQGEYISKDELLKALEEYVILKPNEETKSKKEDENEKKYIKVTKKYKTPLPKIMAVVAATSILISGLSINREAKFRDPIPTGNVSVSHLEYNLEEQYADAFKALGVEVGSPVSVEAGTKANSRSDMQGHEITIGEGIRKSGEYQVSGVSIKVDGKVIDFYTDTRIQNPGFDIGQFVVDKIAEYNLDAKDVELALHLGNATDNTRTGWIDINDLTNLEQIAIAPYQGIINNFRGDSITIDTPNGPVVIKILDANGNLIQNGTTVIGSDGRPYQINGLELTKEVIESLDVMVPDDAATKLSWSIKDCELEAGLLPLLLAVASALATKKKNEEAKKTPKNFEFNKEEYPIFLDKFKKEKENYGKKSKFKKFFIKLFRGKEVQIAQELTEEQVDEIKKIIASIKTEEYSYKSTDRIYFKNGRIMVDSIDGTTKDISEICYPLIYQIGSENKIVAEGFLKEEGKEDGFHKR